jgi:hypothetical protein
VKDFDPIVKIGRTHLQDAAHVRLGQEFSGYGSMVAHGFQRIEKNLGGAWKAPDDYKKAISYYKKALQKCEKMLGPNHPLTKTVK